MEKTVKLGAKLHYPITIERIYKTAGDLVERKDTVLEYSYVWHRIVGDDTRQIEERQRVVTSVTWACPVDGDILEIFLREGQVVNADTRCLLVNELCNHEVQFNGMCGMCGKDMTTLTWANDERDADRATVCMSHDHTSLTVSRAVAQRHATEQQTRLLGQRRLSLVVDLDQTIIHACIDPTVGEWQRDPENPNYDAVRDVKSFQLNDDGCPRGLATGCWYYIKLRPGLREFLDEISDMYELHVYTMGTRAYAQNIAKLVDPDQKLFGNRLISRDENGSLTAKNLERLFPTSTGMVAIIDDRADVWPRDRDNLIKVVPYDFFKGIGDINSSFLPKRQDIAPVPSPEPPPNGDNGTHNTNGGLEDGTSGPERSSLHEAAKPESDILMSAARLSVDDKTTTGPQPGRALAAGIATLEDDSALRKKQAEEQEHLLERQLKERPLLHQQEQLDKEDELASSTQSTAAAAADGASTDSEPSSSQSSAHQRHNLLRDDDTELVYLSQHLTNLHREFYDQYDRNRRASNAPGSNTSNVDLSQLPNVGRVLSRLKRKVLAGTTIVLSGLLPVDVPVYASELGRQVKSFGAAIHSKVTQCTTHLVISTARPRTQKVRQAAKIPSIKIVNQNWLVDCMSQWRKLDPDAYQVDVVHPADRLQPLRQAPPRQAEDDPSTSDLRSKRPQPGNLSLIVQDASGQNMILDQEEQDDGFNSDDEGMNHLSNDEYEDDDHDEDEPEDPEDPELEELKEYQPGEIQDGESSPIDEMTFNWGEAEEELAEFLEGVSDDSEDGGDHGHGDDNESTDEASSKPLVNGSGARKVSRGLKRRHEDAGEADTDSNIEREIKKRPRVEVNGSRAGQAAENALPTPRGTGDEDEWRRREGVEEGKEKGNSAGDDGDGDDDDALEADLIMAFMEEEETAQSDKG